ncbi:hypothetical protein AB2N08_22390 [Massilia aurea]|uniref:hypothetical protein n=1 Tax=Massilia aurea TaxID=373040 RepID=UPI0034620D11
MNHALNDKPAAPGTARGRLARLARLGVLACALAAAGSGALAQDQDRNRRSDDAQARERYEMQAQRDARAFEMREQGRRNPEAQQDAAREERPRGRLSADERRDLRRQIKEGADLYPNSRRR